MDYRMNSLRVDFLTVGFSWELPGELTNLNLSGFFLGLTERGIFAVKHGRFLGQNISCTSKYVDFNTTWQCLIWHPAVKGSLLAGHRCLWKWPFGSMIYPAMMHMLVSKTRSDMIRMIRFPLCVLIIFFIPPVRRKAIEKAASSNRWGRSPALEEDGDGKGVAQKLSRWAMGLGWSGSVVGEWIDFWQFLWRTLSKLPSGNLT